VFPQAVRAVVFDVVGTLVEPWPAVPVAYRDAARRHGIERDVDEIRGRFAAAWKKQESIDAAATPPHVTSPAREEERWRSIVADVFESHPAVDAIFADLWDHFGRPESWRPLSRGRDLVARAVDAGLEIALASNFDTRLHGIAAVVEPLSTARHVFASSELGWRKPAVEFFRTVESRLGCRPDELMLIGDDPQLDVAAASRAGWHAHGIG
jgi:putative hydrolase of the HAD superfamily